MKKLRKLENGITLIALVVTIVVLLILATVSISMLTGENGIITQAQKAKLETKISEIEEQANVIYSDLSVEKYTEKIEDITMLDIVLQLKEKGYQIEQIVTSGREVTGISINPTNISLATEGISEITVTYEGSTTEVNEYYALISGKYYKMIFTNNGVKLERTPSDVSGSTDTEELTATSSDTSYVTVEGIEGNIITLKGGSGVGTATITVKYGSYEKTCTVSVVIKPTDDSTADSSVSFSTKYGRIDIIWLNGTSNTVVTKPNAPILTANNESMTPVKWNSSNQIVETTENDTEWYNYTAGSGTADNTSSKWANAKTANDSYFVWIPRYAYRITYYDSQTSTEPTGYYDGYGMWRASDRKLKYELESVIETVEYNGNKYIVHPAFQDNLEHGGWSNKLSGIWVAKFEINGTGTSLKSTFGVASTRGQNIGTEYTSARQATYGYTGVTDTDGNTSYMYSHMMKRSEWGAVAYLTHSAYGRNGNEITQNTSKSYYTGGASGNTGYITNVAQSTTGNTYGIYDISGGSWEYTAGFNSTDSNGYFSTYGWTTATGLTVDSSSTKYATRYDNDSTTFSGTLVYTIGKIGDAMKEVYGGTGNPDWLGDYPNFINASNPFFDCGGHWYDSSGYAGVFACGLCSGSGQGHHTFRTVLCP